MFKKSVDVTLQDMV